MSIGLAASTRVGEVQVASRANREMIQVLIRRLPTETDALVLKYGRLVRARARVYAPSSSRTRARGKDSNNPHEQTLYDSIALNKQGPARYRVVARAPHARYLLTGTGQHYIIAGGYAAKAETARIRRGLRSVQADLDRAIGGRRKFEDFANRSARPHRTKAQIQERHNRLAAGVDIDEENRLESSESALFQERERQRSRLGGKRNLIFPWTKGRVRPGGGHLGPSFIGPIVLHPGHRAYPFLQRAQSDYTLPFFRDLQRLFQGKGLR